MPIPSFSQELRIIRTTPTLRFHPLHASTSTPQVLPTTPQFHPPTHPFCPIPTGSATRQSDINFHTAEATQVHPFDSTYSAIVDINREAACRPNTSIVLARGCLRLGLAIHRSNLRRKAGIISADSFSPLCGNQAPKGAHFPSPIIPLIVKDENTYSFSPFFRRI